MAPFDAQEKPTFPFNDYLPDGPVKDWADSYIDRLPNVREHPLTPETFLEPGGSSWSEYAAAYVLVYPYAAFLLALVGAAVYFVWRKWKEHREGHLKEACVYCGESIYLCAPHCQRCRNPHEHVMGVGLTGFTLTYKTAGPNHLNRLRRFRRCHFCASVINQSGIFQNCPVCGTSTFRDMAGIREFDRYVQKRHWFIYAVVFIVGLVPIIGPLISSTFYRRTLIAPYSLYMSFRRDGILFAILSVFRTLFRYLPFIGIIGIPLLAVIENYSYRKSFFGKARQFDQ